MAQTPFLSGIDFKHFPLKLVLDWISLDNLAGLGLCFSYLTDKDSRDMSLCARSAFAGWYVKPLDAESHCAIPFFSGKASKCFDHDTV